VTEKALRVSACAHAKVNLDLRLLASRPDGYHELRTLFQTIELHDSVVCTTRRGPFEVKCRTPGVPRDESNLVWKAATALWTALGRRGHPADTVVGIEKWIPMQAGLGGGSADAAAALRALARLWGGAPSGGLEAVATGLGADVAFFLHGGTALGLGRGEEIYPLVDLPPQTVLIARPPFGVSTAEAYAWYDADRAAGLGEPPSIQRLPVTWPARAAEMRNELEPAVVRRHPEIGAIRGALEDAGAIVAAMSGSGSAVFGLFGSRAAAAKAVARAPWPAGTWTCVTRTLDRAAYGRRSRPVLRRSLGSRGR
jgi:4-diphosphocytidyl-2-C-methyl-D-erythritol kinase